ncbi:VirB4 family type IV secretion system protein [Vibrio cholerae]|nr:type IV secretion system protein B4 [Vibrio cholerae]
MTALNTKIRTYAEANSFSALTNVGSILGALSLSGVEAELLSTEDKLKLTRLLRNILQKMPFEADITQIYFHYDCEEIKFKNRKHKRAELVSSRRAKFLNDKRDLYQSKLFWIVTVNGLSNYSDLGKEFVNTMFKAILDKNERSKLKQAMSYRQSIVLEQRDLLEKIDVLDQCLSNLDLGISFRSLDNQRLSSGDLFQLQKTLITYNTDNLSVSRKAPLDNWDVLLSEAEVNPVVIEGVTYLKIQSSKTIYLRIASVRGVGDEYVPDSAWSSDFRPVLEKGNYSFFTRFIPYSKQDKRKYVTEKEDELYRSQMSVLDLFSGESNHERVNSRIQANPKLKAVQEELLKMSADDDKYGDWYSFICVFDEDVEALKARVKRLKSVLENSEFYLLWESVGLLHAYESMLLGYKGDSIRKMTVNSSQAAAMSLFYRSNEGLKTWQFGESKEEALFVFESNDGVPFHYTPFVGDKCLIIGTGATRSGKTFLKQCVANHFLKLGGMYCAMDVDSGSEPLAAFFQSDASIFRLADSQTTKGFNPFSMSRGKGDDEFVRHMMTLINLMLKMNDAEDLRSLNSDEQIELERAIQITMEGSKELQSFSSMLGQCKPNVQKKLGKFRQGGLYGNLFDNVEDAVGVLDKPYSVYNIQGVKDSPELAQLVNTEIFFRAVRLFEDPQYRTRAKFLEVDECQYTFTKKGAAEFLIAKARTWFKHGGGMGFWTQSPKHYSSLDEWSTLRSAATTFIFMADPEMETAEYKHAFPFLGDNEIDVIMNLKPKQQAFIKQMDVGISKVINLFVEPEQYVIATSRPHEAVIAKEILDSEVDVDIAIEKIIKRLNL